MLFENTIVPNKLFFFKNVLSIKKDCIFAAV